jgi:hypothetical protein
MKISLNLLQMSKKKLFKYLAGVVSVLLLAMVGLYFTSSSESDFTVDTPPPGLELDAGYNATLSGVPFYTVTQDDEDMYDDSLPACSSVGDEGDRGNGWYSLVAYEDDLTVGEIIFGQAELEKGDSLLAVYYNPELKTFEALPNRIIKGDGGVDLPLLNLNKTLKKGEVVVVNSNRTVDFCNDYAVAAGHEVMTAGAWNLVAKPDFTAVDYRSIWEVDFGKTAESEAALRQYYREGDANFDAEDELSEGDLFWIYGGNRSNDAESGSEGSNNGNTTGSINVDQSIIDRIQDAFRPGGNNTGDFIDPRPNIDLETGGGSTEEGSGNGSEGGNTTGGNFNLPDGYGNSGGDYQLEEGATDRPTINDGGTGGSYDFGDVFNRPDLTVDGSGNDFVTMLAESGRELDGGGYRIVGEILNDGTLESGNPVTLQCNENTYYIEEVLFVEDANGQRIDKADANNGEIRIVFDDEDGAELIDCLQSESANADSLYPGVDLKEISNSLSLRDVFYDQDQNTAGEAGLWIVAETNNGLCMNPSTNQSLISDLGGCLYGYDIEDERLFLVASKIKLDEMYKLVTLPNQNGNDETYFVYRSNGDMNTLHFANDVCTDSVACNGSSYTNPNTQGKISVGNNNDYIRPENRVTNWSYNPARKSMHLMSSQFRVGRVEVDGSGDLKILDYVAFDNRCDDDELGVENIEDFGDRVVSMGDYVWLYDRNSGFDLVEGGYIRLDVADITMLKWAEDRGIYQCTEGRKVEAISNFDDEFYGPVYALVDGYNRVSTNVWLNNSEIYPDYSVDRCEDGSNNCRFRLKSATTILDGGLYDGNGKYSDWLRFTATDIGYDSLEVEDRFKFYVYDSSAGRIVNKKEIYRDYGLANYYDILDVEDGVVTYELNGKIYSQ